MNLGFDEFRTCRDRPGDSSSCIQWNLLDDEAHYFLAEYFHITDIYGVGDSVFSKSLSAFLIKSDTVAP